MKRLERICILLVLSYGSGAAATQDFVPGSRYTTGRGEGMAGAYLPMGDDGASGLFYQPAAIAKIPQPQFEPLNFQVKPNQGYVSSVNENFYKVFDLGDFQPQLEAFEGTTVGVGGTLVSSFAMRGLAIGVLARSDLLARREGEGDVWYRSKYQIIPAAGVALPISRGIVRLGYSFQWVNQASGERTVSDTDANLGYTEGLAQGSGFSHNIGFALSLPVRLEPTFDLVIRNIGGLKFTSTSSLIPFASNPSGTPDDEPMTIDAAFGIRPRLGRGSKMSLVLEWRDISNTSDTSVLGRAALGAEFSFHDRFFVRGGWGRGYPALGIGLQRERGELSAAWFSEEIGDGYLSHRDMKFMVHYRIKAF